MNKKGNILKIDVVELFIIRNPNERIQFDLHGMRQRETLTDNMMMSPQRQLENVIFKPYEITGARNQPTL